MQKKATSFRLSEDALSLLAQLSESIGVSATACVELAVRELAKKHGVKALAARK